MSQTPRPLVVYLTNKDSATVGGIAQHALGFQTNRIGRADQNRIIAILERLNWRRYPRDWKGNIKWGPA